MQSPVLQILQLPMRLIRQTFASVFLFIGCNSSVEIGLSTEKRCSVRFVYNASPRPHAARAVVFFFRLIFQFEPDIATNDRFFTKTLIMGNYVEIV